MREGKQTFLKYETFVDVNKCLNRIKLPVLLYNFTPISELLSIITTYYGSSFALPSMISNAREIATFLFNEEFSAVHSHTLI